MMARHAAQTAAQDYRNPAVWQQMQQQMASMDPATKFLYAQAHGIPAAAIGMYPQTINYLAQSLMGFSMDKRTGQIVQQNGDGTNTPVQSGQLQQAVQQRNGADITQTGGMALTGINQSTYGMGVGGKAGQAAAAYSSANPVSPSYGSGGGGGAPGYNPYGGSAGLAGSAGNAVRQQMMDSQQFNPNGANTYAIQNMNLSGQGDLGSNMGGMAGSNGMYPSQTTALGSGAISGTAMPSTTPNYTTATNQNQTASMPTATGVMTSQTSPYSTQTPSYFNTGNGARGGMVRQGGATGGANGGTFTGVINNGNGITSQNPGRPYGAPTNTTAPPPQGAAPSGVTLPPPAGTSPYQHPPVYGGGGGRPLARPQ